MGFKDRLKELRAESGLTQKELAAKLSITRSAYSLYELGTREPSIVVLIDMAKFFEVTLDYLVGISDNY